MSRRVRQTIQQTEIGDVEILHDGRTVWVNDTEGNIGRFGPFGIDVHRTIAEQIATGSECLACTHGPTSLTDWRQFQALMQEHHGVTVSDDHMPLKIKIELLT
jgi:hypothetical protein